MVNLVSGTVHLGSVLCRDYGIALDDHMAIKDEDGPIRDLISLNYIHTSLKNYYVGVVRSLTQSISALYYEKTMKMVIVTTWPLRTIMV